MAAVRMVSNRGHQPLVRGLVPVHGLSRTAETDLHPAELPSSQLLCARACMAVPLCSPISSCMHLCAHTKRWMGEQAGVQVLLHMHEGLGEHSCWCWCMRTHSFTALHMRLRVQTQGGGTPPFSEAQPVHSPKKVGTAGLQDTPFCSLPFTFVEKHP